MSRRQVPPEYAPYIGRWNWGAFLLSAWWPFWNGATGFGLLISVLNLGVLIEAGFAELFNALHQYSLAGYAQVGMFGQGAWQLGLAVYLGSRGNELTIKNRGYSSVSEFVAVQTTWANWAGGCVIVGIILGLIYAITHTLW